MIKKYILIIVLLLTSNISFAGDFYSEAEFNPFESELNPSYIDKNTYETNGFELKKFIKQKLHDRKTARGEKEKVKAEKKAAKRAAEESFITNAEKPKKHLTNAQLERELNKEEREKERALRKQHAKEQNLNLFERIFTPDISKKAKNNTAGNTYTPPAAPNINITADTMEYFPDVYEIHASGNAKAEFKAQKSKIEADKIIFDYDKNILTAEGSVLLTAKGSETEGSFLKLDLTKPDGWIEKPLTNTEDIQITAEEAFLYSDKIEELNGSAKILKDNIIVLGGHSFSAYTDQSGILRNNAGRIDSRNKGIYKIKAEKIIIDSKDDHEIITVKKAGVYFKNHKFAAVPSLRIVSNKEQRAVETNFPEFGSQSMLGSYIGPGIVLSMPGGSALKLAPVLTYGNSKLGFGGIARFRSETNVTQAAYGSSKQKFILRGRQKLAPGLNLNYSRYYNQSEWFLGFRMPKYTANLEYGRSDYIKDLGLTFSQLYSAGIYVDNLPEYDLSNNHARFRWMTQIYKPVYTYKIKESNSKLELGLITQTAASVYSQGNTLGLVRAGGALNTELGRWKQSIMYFQSASAGDSPFEFDRYRYGKSNLIFIESLNICKYLSAGYTASIAMNNQYRHDYHEDHLLQESRFMAALGPEHTKLILGYDAVRHNFSMTLSMLLGTKNSDVEFKKAIINNPDKIGREKKKQKQTKKKSYKKYVKEAV